MGARTEFSNEEVEAAFRNYWHIGALSERWTEWPDIFTEDVVYVEHIYGTMMGRETVRTWITELMGENSDIHALLDWYMIDKGRVVVNMINRYYNPNPNDATKCFDFPGITILEYAGDGLFSYEEDYWDVRLAKQAYASFNKGLAEFGRDFIVETPERMKLRDPWPAK